MNDTKFRTMMSRICQEIGGDWLLLGGSLVRLEFDANRGTQDIDLVNLSHPHLSSQLVQAELFKLAKTEGLTPEAVNSAAGFFVRQVPGWESEVVELRSEGKGRIFRPTLTLFVYLKLKRASEIDLGDIAAAVKSLGSGEFREAQLRQWAEPEVWKKFESSRTKWGL